MLHSFSGSKIRLGLPPRWDQAKDTAINNIDDEVTRMSVASGDFVMNVEHYRQTVAQRLGIGETGVNVLNFLQQDGPASAGALAKRTDTTSGSMTATLDRLETHKYIGRTTSPTDRRSILITLTPLGAEVIAWILRIYREALTEALASHPEVNTPAVGDYLASAGALVRQKAEELPVPEFKN